MCTSGTKLRPGKREANSVINDSCEIPTAKATRTAPSKKKSYKEKKKILLTTGFALASAQKLSPA